MCRHLPQRVLPAEQLGEERCDLLGVRSSFGYIVEIRLRAVRTSVWGQQEVGEDPLVLEVDVKLTDERIL